MTAYLLTVMLTVSTAQAQVSPGVEIRVSNSKTCYIADVGVPCKEIGAKLRAMKVESTVHIHVVGDLDVSYELVHDAIESLHQAGYSIVAGFLTH